MSRPCARCGATNADESRFCGTCGTALQRTCAACGATVPDESRFCGACGTPLPGIDATDAPAMAPAMPSERRRVSVLFADLVGFSTLAEHLDPEELRTLMADSFGALTEEVEQRDGMVEKFIGDAIVAIFGAPRAHEDDPERAVDAALAMQAIVAGNAYSAPVALRLRIGINSGLVVSGMVGDGSQTGVMGDAVNVAARLQQAAEPGEVLVSAPVWRRIQYEYETRPVGSLEVKGRDEPVVAYAVGPAREAGARRQAPFVGRRDERRLLELLWSSAEKGNTHIMSVIGEPGVGKSRLLNEFQAGGGEVRVTCGIGDRPFGPIVEIVSAVLGGEPNSADDLSARNAELGIDESTTRLLAALLGLRGGPPSVRMADEQQKRQIFAGVWQFLVAAARIRPLLVVLDDLHWADRSTLELLDFLLDRLSGVPLMLILSHRPAFDPTDRTVLHASHTVIRLEALTDAESLEVGRGYLGVPELPPDLERIIATRAEGNPFFIEELIQALLEIGSLQIADGRALLTTNDVDIPDTVQGTILARIDRLGPDERSLLQHAAVIGRTFHTSALESMSGRTDVADLLANLGRAQLVVGLGPDSWTFKHALIQEVAYETLLVRQRRELHRHAAEAIERDAANEPAAVGALAQHFAKAGETEQARRYGVLAGDLAAEQLGFADALERYRAALALWGMGDDEGRLELLGRLGQTAVLGGDYPGGRSALAEAIAGWRERGEPARAGLPLVRLIRAHWLAGDNRRAYATLDEALALLEPLGPSADLVNAYVRGSSLFMLDGRIDDALELGHRGLTMAEQLGLDIERANLLNTIATSEGRQGNPAGIDRLREALELAERTGDPEAIGRAWANLGSSLANDFDRHRDAIGVCQEGRTRMRALGAPGYEWFIAGNEAHSLVEVGDYADADSLAAEILGPYRAVMAASGLTQTLCGRARVELMRGHHDASRRLLAEAEPIGRALTADSVFPILVRQAELEEADGNLAAARMVIRELLPMLRDNAAPDEHYAGLDVAARLLPADEVRALPLFDGPIPELPGLRARHLEVCGIMDHDLEILSEAAALYRSVELPYQEARALAAAGCTAEAAAIVERLGIPESPVGRAVAQA